MPERKKERSRKKVDNPTDPHTVETKKGKQTKFVLDVGDIAFTPDQLEEVRSDILKNSLKLIRDKHLTSLSGAEVRPKIGVEEFSVSFSVSFSLGA